MIACSLKRLALLSSLLFSSLNFVSCDNSSKSKYYHTSLIKENRPVTVVDGPFDYWFFAFCNCHMDEEENLIVNCTITFVNYNTDELLMDAIIIRKHRFYVYYYPVFIMEEEYDVDNLTIYSYCCIPKEKTDNFNKNINIYFSIEPLGILRIIHSIEKQEESQTKYD